MLKIDNLTVAINKQMVLDDICLCISSGTTHVLMGHNGSGKSSLAAACMGHPSYVLKKGIINFDGNNITDWGPDKRARAGLFLAAQQQHGIPGLQVFQFVKEVIRLLHGTQQDVAEIYDDMCDYMDLLGIDQRFAYRYLHDGFSGGEKKRFELLQLLMFKPKLAILDEIDSGLDIDGQLAVIDALKLVKEQAPDTALLLISHQPQMVAKLSDVAVHILSDGKLVYQGTSDILPIIEKKGYHGIGAKSLEEQL